MLRIITIEQDPERFARWRGEDLFGVGGTSLGFSRDYYPAVFAGSHRDATFAVVQGEGPVALVPATLSDAGLDYFGLPLRLFSEAALSDAAIDCLFAHIDHLASSLALGRVLIREDNPGALLAPLGKACLNRKYRPSLLFTAIADLRDGEAGLRRGLRKSFKSLLNWGREHMEIRSVAQAAPDRALFARYQQFHLQIAGRATRPQDSWDVMFSLIAAGRGELVLGFLPGDELVAGTMVLDGDGSSHYVSGVYDRDRFDKPIAHWPLWVAMLNAGRRGSSLFELGEVPTEGAASPKEISIGYFKRGFATEIASSVLWRWSRDPVPASVADH